MRVLSLLIILSNTAASSCFMNPDLTKKHNVIFSNSDIEFLMLRLLEKIMDEVNCYVIVLDQYYHNVIGNVLDRPSNSSPHFKVLVDEAEDLLSPDYNTVRVIHEGKKNSCNLYIIFLDNGEQIARLLTFGDRHRTIDPHAKFILIKDRRIFIQKHNILWKKLVNVLFIRQFQDSKRFEFSTVPFPPPLNGPTVPYRINTWSNDSFQYNRPLFEDKTSNLHNQILKVVTFDHVPTTAVVSPPLNPANGGVTKPSYTGLEVEVLKTLGKAMNFDYTIFQPPNAKEEQWGKIQTNGSYSGLLGEMCSGNADIALGNLYYTPFYLNMLDLSIPYNTECLTFLTPESLTDNSWQTLILPFQLSMWIAVIITLFFGGIFCYFFAFYHHNIRKKDILLSTSSSAKSNSGNEKIDIVLRIRLFLAPLTKYLKKKWRSMNEERIFFQNNYRDQERKKQLWLARVQEKLNLVIVPYEDEYSAPKGLYIFERLDNAILYMYGMFMVVSLPRIPLVWTIRMFVGWWWLYCILVSVAYKASLTAILANPAPRVTIDTLEELADSSIDCGGWGEQSKEFFTSSLDVISQKLGLKFEITYDVDAAVERVAEGKFAYYENTHFLHYLTVKYNKANFIESNETKGNLLDKTKGKILHVMQNCVINMPISIGLQKNSPLKPKIDDHLARVVEAGLVGKWLNDAMFKIRATKAEREKQQIESLMTLPKLYGAVIVLIAGYVISILTLLIEIIIWYGYETRRPEFDKYNLPAYYNQKKKGKVSK